MTTEEIDKAAEEYAIKLDVSTFDYKAARKDFREGADFANKYWQEKTKWIPVKERLPQIQANGFSDMVLTRDKHGIIKIERYDQEFGNFSGLRYGGEVTHWKEIE